MAQQIIMGRDNSGLPNNKNVERHFSDLSAVNLLATTETWQVAVPQQMNLAFFTFVSVDGIPPLIWVGLDPFLPIFGDDFLLLEDLDEMLLEDGDNILLEGSSALGTGGQTLNPIVRTVHYGQTLYLLNGGASSTQICIEFYNRSSTGLIGADY